MGLKELMESMRGVEGIDTSCKKNGLDEGMVDQAAAEYERKARQSKEPIAGLTLDTEDGQKTIYGMSLRAVSRSSDRFADVRGILATAAEKMRRPLPSGKRGYEKALKAKAARMLVDIAFVQLEAAARLVKEI